MSITYHPVPGSFFDKLYDFVTAMEGPTRRPENVGDGTITLGPGYNITSGPDKLRDEVFKAIGLDPTTRTYAGNDPAILLEKDYVTRLTAATKAGWSQAATLHAIMAERAAKYASDPAFATYIGASAPRATFAFSEGATGVTEMKAAFVEGSKSYIDSANAQLGFSVSAPTNFAISWEKIALVSLRYNGFKLDKVNMALAAGDRAEAWFQIRYAINYLGRKVSQGIALNTVPPRPGGTSEQDMFNQGIDKGWAKRRFAESQLFGLYDDASNVQLPEAKQVFQMLERHRSDIVNYEKTYGVTPDGSAPTRGNQVAAAASDSNYIKMVAVKGLIESLNVGKATILADLRTANPNLTDKLQDGQWLSTNIYLAKTASVVSNVGSTLDSTGYEFESFSAITLADLMIGDAGNDSLKGNRGSNA